MVSFEFRPGGARKGWKDMWGCGQVIAAGKAARLLWCWSDG